ncbi:myelin basic protein-like [Paramormyrops kingsleyae]|uniref:myelin basic protein-like n=1 Tax=Paramormyrops kingsleyae TaxID=1676925 RepID=UPI000CD65239|nr:myelin basic protein-like [Paramormyrops kingsleyae]
MGQFFGKQSPHMEKTSVPEPGGSQTSEKADDDNEVFGQGEADACLNNGRPTKGTAPTDSAGAGNAGNCASTADPNSSRPHLVRLFSRDAPGRQDNTFKDRPSESDELHTIPECAAEPSVQDSD